MQAHMWFNLAAAAGAKGTADARDIVAEKNDTRPNCRGSTPGPGIDGGASGHVKILEIRWLCVDEANRDCSNTYHFLGLARSKHILIVAILGIIYVTIKGMGNGLVVIQYYALQRGG